MIELRTKVAKTIIKTYVRREQLEPQIERGEFDLIGPGGLKIEPQVWPTGVAPGSVIDLIIWDANEGHHVHTAGQERGQERQENVGTAEYQRHQDIRQREQDARENSEKQDARQREQDARQREQDARQREQDARQRDSKMRRSEKTM